jgi:hypothetical protein
MMEQLARRTCVDSLTEASGGIRAVDEGTDDANPDRTRRCRKRTGETIRFVVDDVIPCSLHLPDHCMVGARTEPGIGDATLLWWFEGAVEHGLHLRTRMEDAARERPGLGGRKS